jgi:hypothetical protein
VSAPRSYMAFVGAALAEIGQPAPEWYAAVHADGTVVYVWESPGDPLHTHLDDAWWDHVELACALADRSGFGVAHVSDAGFDYLPGGEP